MPVDSVDGVDNRAVHEKTRKKRADVRGCGSRVRRLWQGKGLRLPFLCMHVIGGCAAEVEPHPSEPFE
jgi:hypothetical protein